MLYIDKKITHETYHAIESTVLKQCDEYAQGTGKHIEELLLMVDKLPANEIGGLSFGYTQDELSQIEYYAGTYLDKEMSTTVLETLKSHHKNCNGDVKRYLQNINNCSTIDGKYTSMSSLVANEIPKVRLHLEEKGIFPLAILPTRIARELMQSLIPSFHTLHCDSMSKDDTFFRRYIGRKYKNEMPPSGRGNVVLGHGKITVLDNDDSLKKFGLHEVTHVIPESIEQNEFETYFQDWQYAKNESGILFSREELLLQNGFNSAYPSAHAIKRAKEGWFQYYDVDILPIQENYLVSPKVSIRDIVTKIVNNRIDIDVSFLLHHSTYKIRSLIGKAEHMQVNKHNQGDPIIIVKHKQHPDVTAFCVQYGDFSSEKKVIEAAEQLDIPAIIQN